MANNTGIGLSQHPAVLATATLEGNHTLVPGGLLGVQAPLHGEASPPRMVWNTVCNHLAERDAILQGMVAF